MDIAPYIQELLAEKDQVNLPGFGLFIKRRLQGYYDGASGKLYPPSERLELLINSNPSEELIDFISAKKHISTASASYFISQFVEALKNRLQSGEVVLSGIGTIGTTNDSYVLSDMVSLPANAFGLGVLSNPVISSSTKKQVQKQPVQVVEEADFIREKRAAIPSYLYWLLTLVIVLLVAGIFYYYHPELFPISDKQQKEAVKKATQPVLDPAITQQEVPTDTLRTSAPVETATTETPVSPLENPVKKSTEATDAETLQYDPQAYEIIGASFKTVTSAKEQVKRFGWKGVPAKILKNTRGKRIKISLGSFKDATSAQMELKRLKAELKNKELFIEPYKTK